MVPEDSVEAVLMAKYSEAAEAILLRCRHTDLLTLGLLADADVARDVPTAGLVLLPLHPLPAACEPDEACKSACRRAGITMKVMAAKWQQFVKDIEVDLQLQAAEHGPSWTSPTLELAESIQHEVRLLLPAAINGFLGYEKLVGILIDEVEPSDPIELKDFRRQVVDTIGHHDPLHMVPVLSWALAHAEFCGH